MNDQILSPKMLGYWDDDGLKEATDEPGIYCVYRAAKDPESGEMEVQELLHVGESGSARYGIQHDESRPRWEASLQPDEALWYAIGPCGKANRERLKAALINAHKPRLDADSPYLERFPFDRTTVHLYGRKEKLQAIFTVERQD
ncbi:hypothetical protein SAMN04487957_105217 [Halomonas shengliensis]|uniref:Uncharacterized protein n=1 Tax=Halomonas shengliensis TaxID=419597 RepID=A0A1H0IQ43_9GAMM|nr:hypothetical protein [Halomonas shengliensis]SDO33567.1 hypothetical protein SAMN04487957_105217 [Halomonas shengliensis]